MPGTVEREFGRMLNIYVQDAKRAYSEAVLAKGVKVKDLLKANLYFLQ